MADPSRTAVIEHIIHRIELSERLFIEENFGESKVFKGKNTLGNLQTLREIAELLLERKECESRPLNVIVEIMTMAVFAPQHADRLFEKIQESSAFILRRTALEEVNALNRANPVE